MEEKKLYVGFAKGVNNPPMGMHIPGHGGVPRPSCGILDDLYVYAVAFSDGENKGILFNCDALGITTNGSRVIQNAVAERCGLDPDAVYHIAETDEDLSGAMLMNAGYWFIDVPMADKESYTLHLTKN